MLDLNVNYAPTNQRRCTISFWTIYNGNNGGNIISKYENLQSNKYAIISQSVILPTNTSESQVMALTFQISGTVQQNIWTHITVVFRRATAHVRLLC